MEDWIWLQQAAGFGNAAGKKLIEKFGSAEAVRAAYKAGKPIFDRFALQRLHDLPPNFISQTISSCKANGIKIIPYSSNEYPLMLREINNPPVVLYAMGDVSFLNHMPCVCIAGPRDCTPYGIKSTFALSARLTIAGFAIISGGADGADTAAHLGSLSLFGKTALIMPCGLLCSYREHRRAFRERIIANGGCLISEYPPFMPSSRNVYRVRNRIMSGLAVSTVVPEAGHRSGALITAGHAAEQGREVFVVPSKKQDEYHSGSNALLNDGATPLTNAMQIIEAASIRFENKLFPAKAFCEQSNAMIAGAYELALHELFEDEQPKGKAKLTFAERRKAKALFAAAEETDAPKKRTEVSALSKDAQLVLAAIYDDLFIPDGLDIDVDLLDNGIFMALFELEKAGYIKTAPSGYYRRIV